MTTLVLDIETVKNERLADYIAKFEPAPEPPAPEPEPETEEPPKKKRATKPKREKAAAKKGKAERPGLSFLTGRVACICVKPIGKPVVTFAMEDEDVLLGGFYDYLVEHRPISLVGFNTKGFDVPFIIMRGYLHGYDFQPHLPNDRFSKNHLDLYADTLGGKWSSQNGKLSELCWYFGIQDLDGSGADVQRMYDADDWEGIVAHCVGDVTATEELMFKLLPHRRV